MFKKILVPLDGSSLATKILPQVEDLAKSEKSQITLLTVGQTSSIALIAEAPPSLIEETLATIKRSAEKHLTEVGDALKAKGLRVNWVYREGLPAREIIRYADEARFDLIAMATHGRGEIAWVLGSVAEQVVSHATVPVLLWRVIKAHPLVEKEQLLSEP